MFGRITLLAIAFISVGFSAGCKTTEEKIKEHFQSAQTLREDGDYERALVELRNVFKLDGRHKDARLMYAKVEETRGNFKEAFGQYLRLVEQYPENLVGRRALARLALEANNWDEVEKHIKVAAEIAPEDPLVRAIKASLAYRDGLLNDSSETREAAVAEARQLVKSDAGGPIARRLIIDDLLRRQDWNAALREVNAALEQQPDNRRLYTIRLGVMEKLGRSAEIEAQLEDMLDRFPDDRNVERMLLRWYVSRDRIDDAEEFLRDAAGAAKADAAARVRLVEFLTRYRGRDAALAELDKTISGVESAEDKALFRAMRASLNFAAGTREDAMAELEEILETAAPSEQTGRIRIALAKMRIATGNSVGARALVEEVLAEDKTSVEALKLKAGWLIDDDKTGDALVELRRALNQSPRDPEVMTLMARAHERAGNRDLMAEMLSNAVDASGNAAEESVRYATYLISEGNLLPAESVLQDALRLQPDHVELLRLLGDVYVRMQDWPRLETVINALERSDTQRSKAIANDLTVRLLASRNRSEELESFLQGLAESDESGLNAESAIIRKRLAEGDAEGALSYVDQLLEEEPDNQALRYLRAGVLALTGEPGKAIGIYRDLLKQAPQTEQLWLTLYRLHTAMGNQKKAEAVLEEGLSALPDAPNLLWAKAGRLERMGKIENAITIYEKLYESNSNSLVVANNLASLISSYNDTTEGLERAYNIARRLRGTDVPAFQDTYGWIAFRLGNHEEALGYLEPAAENLPNEPLVRYHLAEIYAALGRRKDARSEYQAVLSLLDQTTSSKPAYFDRVKAQIDKLAATGETPGASSDTTDTGE